MEPMTLYEVAFLGIAYGALFGWAFTVLFYQNKQKRGGNATESHERKR